MLLLSCNLNKISVILQGKIEQYAHQPVVSIKRAVNRFAAQFPNRGTEKSVKFLKKEKVQ